MRDRPVGQWMRWGQTVYNPGTADRVVTQAVIVRFPHPGVKHAAALEAAGVAATALSFIPQGCRPMRALSPASRASRERSGWDSAPDRGAGYMPFIINGFFPLTSSANGARDLG